ncbi:MAG TPA: hypothetical protein VFM05_09360 [Candidatus Saccharimonadales bacterium]|nr:hypothetical protein [Candidatus Saccharimonadales bacterium]
MRLEYFDLLGKITALDKLIEAQSELVLDLKQDLTNDAQTLSSEMVQLRELSEQIIVLRHLRQTRFEMEGKSFLLRNEQLRPMLEQEAS